MMLIPVSLRVLESKPPLCAVPAVPVNTAISRSAPISLSELSRLLKRSLLLLECCRSQFGDEGVMKILTVDTIAALPQMMETLQELEFEQNAGLEGKPVTYLDYQTDQGSD
jgi:hypothetical protein